MEIEDTKKYLKMWADSGDDDFCRHALDYIQSLEALIEKQRDLIMKAAPLAWSHDVTAKYHDDAYKWEKEAEQLLKEEWKDANPD